MTTDLEILPVERGSSLRAGKQPQFIDPENHEARGFARSGQKILPAKVRARIRGLESRIRILNVALGHTRCFECSDLYRKAIRAAESDIRELTKRLHK